MYSVDEAPSIADEEQCNHKDYKNRYAKQDHNQLEVRPVRRLAPVLRSFDLIHALLDADSHAHGHDGAQTEFGDQFAAGELVWP